MSCSSSPSATPGEKDDTLAWYTGMLVRERANDNASGERIALNGIAGYFETHHQADSALRYYLLEVKAAQRTGLMHEQVNAWVSAARCYERMELYDEGSAALDSAVKTSRASDNMKDIAYALQERAIYSLRDGQPDSALRYFTEEARYDRLLNDSLSLSACFSNMGIAYSDKGNYSTSVVYYLQAIAIADSLGLDTNVAEYSLNAGIVYKNLGNFEEALDYLLNAARFYDEVELVKEQASCYNTIGNIYTGLGNLDEALRFHMLALHYRDSIDHEPGIAMSLNNLGETYMKRGEYDSAIAYLYRAKVMKEKIGSQKSIAITLDLLGETFYRQHDYESAGNFYRQALRLKQESENSTEEAATLNRMAKLFLAWNKPDSAAYMLERSRAILEKSPAPDVLLENYRNTIDLKRATGDADAALHFSDLYLELKDTLLTQQERSALAEMQVKYDTEKKDQEIQLLGERDKARAETLDRRNKQIYSLVVGAAVALLLTFYLLRARKKIIAQQQIIIDHKQATMSELRHRVKNNLQVLTDMLEQQQKRTKDPMVKEKIMAVGHRLDAMLLVHDSLYGDNPDSEVNMHDYLSHLLNNVSASFGYDYARVSAGFHVDVPGMKAEHATNIGVICNELITNSFKYAFPVAENPQLSITMIRSNDTLVLTVADNGPGLPAGVGLGTTETLGLGLVEFFSRDLGASIEIIPNDPGLRVRLIIPYKNHNS